MTKIWVPYFSDLYEPIPRTSLSSSRVAGFFLTIPSNTLLLNTQNAGCSAALLVARRQTLNSWYHFFCTGLSGASRAWDSHLLTLVDSTWTTLVRYCSSHCSCSIVQTPPPNAVPLIERICCCMISRLVV